MPVTDVQIAKATSVDQILRKVYYYVVNGWPRTVADEILPYKHRAEALSIEKGCLLMGYRVIIPQQLQDYVLDELHHNHIGMVRMKALARGYAWWPNMDAEIENRVRSCMELSLIHI